MGETTGIEWADATWSPWWGCTKVSPGCAHCYAETLAHRFGHDVWGPSALRRMMSEAHWRKPLAWDRKAAAEGRRRLVFPSMCDPFEDRDDLDEVRNEFFNLVESTPHLTWLLLTKRPENVRRMVWDRWLTGGWPPNAWMLTTVVNQAEADRLVPELLKVPAPVRGLSVEPMLGPIRFADVPGFNKAGSAGQDIVRRLWVIAGGESGPGARPMHPAWVRSLRDQCERAGVPFHFKQWGAWEPLAPCDVDPTDERVEAAAIDGDTLVAVAPDGSVWADEHRAHGGEPWQPQPGSWWVRRVGKRAAGRLLDGRTWDEVPRG